MNRLLSHYKNFAYRSETYYLLDHFTLKVRDATIRSEVAKYRQEQLERILLLGCTVLSISVFLTIYNCVVKGIGHPALMCTAGTNVLTIFALIAMRCCCRQRSSSLILYCYYYAHALSAIIVYSDKVSSLNQYPKYLMEAQNLINYIVVMCLPIHSFSQGFLLTAPPLLVTVYIQASNEAATQQRYREYLPEALQSELQTSYAIISSSVYKVFTICAAFACSQYL